MHEINVRQAMVPEGAEALDNRRENDAGLGIGEGDRSVPASIAGVTQ
jgi:molybdopterin-biosynthesis enzyme MoeA-like protein